MLYSLRYCPPNPWYNIPATFLPYRPHCNSILNIAFFRVFRTFCVLFCNFSDTYSHDAGCHSWHHNVFSLWTGSCYISNYFGNNLQHASEPFSLRNTYNFCDSEAGVGVTRTHPAWELVASGTGEAKMKRHVWACPPMMMVPASCQVRVGWPSRLLVAWGQLRSPVAWESGAELFASLPAWSSTFCCTWPVR